MKILVQSTLLCFFLFANVTLHANHSDDSECEELIPELVCPPDYWVTCNDEIWNLNIYGQAWVENVSPTVYLNPVDSYYHLDSGCGTGHIIRHFKTFVNNQWVICDQTIWVEPYSPFIEDSINWPLDTVLIGCNPDIDPYWLGYDHGFPHWTDVDCSFVGHSYTDQHVVFGNTCDKIIRHWKVIDWCQYQPNTPYSNGIWYYDQIIKISDGVLPEVVVPPHVKVPSDNCDNAYVTVEKFKLIESTCGDEFAISNNSPYADNNGADASGHYPIGETCFSFYVKYGCGGNRTYTVCVNVEDKVPPTPICIEKLVITLMAVDTDGDGQADNGMAEIWASDFELKSYDNCDNKVLQFSFSPDVEDKVRFFNCDHVGVNYLDMWVTDVLGNRDFCKVELDIQNNGANIPDCDVIIPGAQISGNIYSYPSMRIIDNQEVSLTAIAYDTINSGSIDTIITQGDVIDSLFNPLQNAQYYFYAQDTTILDSRDTQILDLNANALANSEGVYSFYDVLRHHNYMMDFTNLETQFKVNKSDLQALTNHLSGEELISNPIALMAADINDDGFVDDEDLNILRSYVNAYRNNSGIELNTNFVEVDMKSESIQVKNSSMPNYFSMLGIDTITMDFLIYTKGDIVLDEVKMPESNLELRSNPSGVITQLFPNPIKDGFTVSTFTEIGNNVNLKLVDVQGKVVLNTSKYLDSGMNEWYISAADLSQGMYFYTIQNGERVEQGKIFKLD